MVHDALVSDAMISRPKTLPAGATVGEARRAFENEHVHLVLLTDGTMLFGTVARADLAAAREDAPALSVSRMRGRTIGPRVRMDEAREVMVRTGGRRLAVVADDGALLGLLCLKRTRTGFCDDADLADRRTS